MTLTIGQAAPGFILDDQNGNPVALQDFYGKQVVIYFYPKDDTPGCTKEACAFRDLWSDYEEAKVVVIGISPDSKTDHQQFIAKYQLPLTLLCDPDKQVMSCYGAWGEKMRYGKKMIGVIRSTVWIDTKGQVVKHWRQVNHAAKHPAQVLKAIKKAK